MADLYSLYRATGIIDDARDLRAAFGECLHAQLLDRGLIDDSVPLAAMQFAVELGDHIIEMAHRSGPGAARVLNEGVRVITGYPRSYSAR